MKRLLLSLTMAALASFQAGAAPATTAGNASIALSSAAFHAAGMIPARFTCKGANVNPPLALPGIPAGAKSLVLIVDDPDAPGVLFTHWLVWNIAPSRAEIVAASVPSGAVQGTNDFGKVGYDGPCPPSGTHRYFFRHSAHLRVDLFPGRSMA